MFWYLLLTMVIEIPVYFLFDRRTIFYTIFILILANCLTWPIMNILYQHTQIHLLVLETGVTLVEAFIIYTFLDQPKIKALLISLIQNTITTMIGVWINHIKLF